MLFVTEKYINRVIFLIYAMPTIDEHKKTAKDLLDDINEKVRAGNAINRQKIVGFACSEAATNLFALLLHKYELIQPGYNVNHRFFASIQRARKTYAFDFENKEDILSLLIEQEKYRTLLCYGKEKEIKVVNNAISNLFKLKNLIEEMIGERIED